MLGKRKMIYKTVFAIDCEGKTYEIFWQERKESHCEGCQMIISRYVDKEGQFWEDARIGCSSRGDEVIDIEGNDLTRYLDEGQCSQDLNIALGACHLEKQIAGFVWQQVTVELNDKEIKLNVVKRGFYPDKVAHNVTVTNPIPEDILLMELLMKTSQSESKTKKGDYS